MCNIKGLLVVGKRPSRNNWSLTVYITPCYLDLVLYSVFATSNYSKPRLDNIALIDFLVSTADS